MVEFAPPAQLTRDDLIALLKRNFPADWIEPLLADASSLSIFEAAIAVLLRIQDAGDAVTEALYTQTATEGASATSTVRLRRPSGGSVTIAEGTRFFDSRGDVWEAAELLVSASGGEQTVDVPVQTQRQGHWLNTFEPPSFRIYDPLPDIGFYIIAGADAADGGQTDMLALRGRERGMPRTGSETADAYRARLLTFANKVTPRAIQEVVYAALASRTLSARVVELIRDFGLRVVREPFRESSQHQLAGFYGHPGMVCDVHAADLTAGPTLQDRLAATNHLELVLPPLDATITAEVQEVGKALWNAVKEIRAAGVSVRLYYDSAGIVARGAEGLDTAGDWRTNDGSSDADEMVVSVAGHGSDPDLLVASPTGRGAGGTAHAGDVRFSAAALPPEVTAISHVVLRAWVRRGSSLGTPPDAVFVFKSPSGSAVRCLLGDYPLTISSESWRPIMVTLKEDPSTTAAWDLADLQAGAAVFGMANVATAGPTDPLEMSEIVMEVHGTVEVG